MKFVKYTQEQYNEAIRLHTQEELGCILISRKLNVGKNTIDKWLYPDRNRKQVKRFYEGHRKQHRATQRKLRAELDKKAIRVNPRRHDPAIRKEALRLHNEEGWGYWRIARELRIYTRTVQYWLNPASGIASAKKWHVKRQKESDAKVATLKKLHSEEFKLLRKYVV